MAIQATNYDRTKTYSVAEIADVYHPNLLVNGDFQINQREQSEYTTSLAYTVDMWRIYQAKVNVLENGVKVTATNSSQTASFTQLLDTLNGVHTISLKANDKIFTFTFTPKNVEQRFRCDVFNVYVKNDTVKNQTDISLIVDIGKSITVEYVDLFEGNIAYPHVKEDYQQALLRCLYYVEYGEFACQYNNTTYFISGFTYKFPKKDTPNIIFIKTVVDESGTVNGTFEAVSQNTYSCPFIRYNGTSAVGLGNKVLNVRVLITCEPL